MEVRLLHLFKEYARTVATYSDRRQELHMCVQAFIADIELQELTHAGGKPCIVYSDVTEAEL